MHANQPQGKPHRLTSRAFRVYYETHSTPYSSRSLLHMGRSTYPFTVTGALPVTMMITESSFRLISSRKDTQHRCCKIVALSWYGRVLLGCTVPAVSKTAPVTSNQAKFIASNLRDYNDMTLTGAHLPLQVGAAGVLIRICAWNSLVKYLKFCVGPGSSSRLCWS